MQPLIVSVAAVGAELRPEQTPHLPVTPAQLGATAERCQAAGAALIHVHCRNDDGSNTADPARFAAALAAIRERSDLIVQFTTGGAVGMSPQERAAPLAARPDMATLTCGSVNFGDEIFENSFPIMRGILAEMARCGVAYELEIFDAGHLTNARRLEREGLLRFPCHADFVLGVPGGLDASVRNLSFLVESLPPGCTWTVAGIGGPSSRWRPRPSPWAATCASASRTTSTIPRAAWPGTKSWWPGWRGSRPSSGGRSPRRRRRGGFSAYPRRARRRQVINRKESLLPRRKRPFSLTARRALVPVQLRGSQELGIDSAAAAHIGDPIFHSA